MLHGVKNMIGSTTMLVLMLFFVTYVYKLNIRRSSWLARSVNQPSLQRVLLIGRKPQLHSTNISLSATHLEAVESLVLLPSRIQGDIGEILSHEHEEEKGTNQKMFLLILEVIRFLVQQGLPLRGNDDDAENNFIQLLHLHGKHCAPQNFHHWLSKKTNKYTSHEIQNECIQIMALHILREVSKRIASDGFFALMADECTDCSNREQFTINICWVDASLQDNVAFIGLYAVDAINANCLVLAIKDVLIHMNSKAVML